ncbi:MAG TPA: hypothetical protein VFQ80_12865 [Thermomicrobiales bacterium]|nr:hypothetical protein [Thermomicrobiales bacterium]
MFVENRSVVAWLSEYTSSSRYDRIGGPMGMIPVLAEAGGKERKQGDPRGDRGRAEAGGRAGPAARPPASGDPD